jgi:hypothetical protein
MRTLAFVAGMMLFGLGSVPSFAGDHDCPSCEDPTREVCFNLVCHYDFDHDNAFVDDQGESHERCTAASTFKKAVTVDGGEVQDDSTLENNPQLEVVCGGKKIFSSGAHRYTDLLGTRIQGLTGPNPAVLLPRGELHSGAEGQSGSHYSPSTLELAGKKGFARAKGTCFIWTGTP